MTTPDCLIHHLFGTVEGRRPDTFVYRESSLEDELSQHMNQDQQYYLYGDKSYVLRPWLQKAFNEPHLDDQRRAFNKYMSKVCSAVDWSYCEIKLFFTSKDFSCQSLTSAVARLIAMCLTFKPRS